MSLLPSQVVNLPHVVEDDYIEENFEFISNRWLYQGVGVQGGLTVTGALSTVADAPAKAVLTSIIAKGVSLGLWIDGTT